jgi:hypothetical protein
MQLYSDGYVIYECFNWNEMFLQGLIWGKFYCDMNVLCTENDPVSLPPQLSAHTARYKIIYVAYILYASSTLLAAKPSSATYTATSSSSWAFDRWL